MLSRQNSIGAGGVVSVRALPNLVHGALHGYLHQYHYHYCYYWFILLQPLIYSTYFKSQVSIALKVIYHASQTSVHHLYPGIKQNSQMTWIYYLITLFPLGTQKSQYKEQHCFGAEVPSWFWVLSRKTSMLAAGFPQLPHVSWLHQCFLGNKSDNKHTQKLLGSDQMLNDLLNTLWREYSG